MSKKDLEKENNSTKAPVKEENKEGSNKAKDIKKDLGKEKKVDRKDLEEERKKIEEAQSKLDAREKALEEQRKKRKSGTKIFRAKSLKKLSSPEKLDQLIKVTDPKGWIALLSAGIVIFLVIVWSFIGTLSNTIVANGVLVSSAGIRTVQHNFGGHITDLAIREGTNVRRGDIVARIASRDILDQLSTARLELSVLEDEQSRLEKFLKSNQAIQKEYFTRAAEIKNSALNSINNESNTSNKEIEALRIQNELNRLKNEELVFKRDNDEKILNIKNDIEAKKQYIEFLKNELEERSSVITPFTGRVISVEARNGDMLLPGQVVCYIEEAGRHVRTLEGTILVPDDQARSIKPGMEVMLSPRHVPVSEFGFMLGTVESVSEYPTSFKQLSSFLGAEIANQFSSDISYITVRVRITPDKNISGFRWSFRSGPPFKIRSGTHTKAEIVISKRRPIMTLFPSLLSRLGG